ncbi:metallophosphoesterase family protein [Desulforhopalus singaporensis]|uniref:metallophosphoesterase family protein n=1 Tax=Desulforhopalus singaporensis TaxID=91360 RepID=UPI000B84DD70|nr:metallophosphoesterase [Desulforhopalus singaporensis]
MKIIAFSDIHSATAVFEKIPGLREADLVLLNGDLTNYGGIAETKHVLDAVMRINPNVLAQFGNLDHGEVNDYLEQLDINLHGQARLVQDRVCLIGVGGSNFTPFNTPSEFSEKALHRLAVDGFRQAAEYIRLAEPLLQAKIPVILVSHAPPFNTGVDRIHSGKHVGSTAIRTVIEHYSPALCITGHIHEGKGVDLIGQTPIYNPGMLRREGWVTVTVENSQLKATLQ